MPHRGAGPWPWTGAARTVAKTMRPNDVDDKVIASRDYSSATTGVPDLFYTSQAALSSKISLERPCLHPSNSAGELCLGLAALILRARISPERGNRRNESGSLFISTVI